MLKSIKKRLAIRSYRNKLGPCLKRRYGLRSNYTPLQVRNCALSAGVNRDYLPRGVASPDDGHGVPTV